MYLCVLHAHIERMTKELESKMCNFFIILSSCENWVTQIWKMLIQLDSSHQYNHFEVQHACVTIKIKEVMNIFRVLLHVLIPIFYDSCSDTLTSSIHVPCVLYAHIERMTKELESKMCNFLSFWVVMRTGLLKFEKFLFSWILLTNMIILSATCLCYNKT